MTALAIVSDLHCHPKGAEKQSSWFYSDAPRLPSENHPIQALIDLIRAEKLNAHCLLAPGDLTNQIDPQGFNTAFDAIREISRELDCKMLAITVGNHDIDSRKVHGADPFRIAKTLHPEFPSRVSQDNDSFWNRGFFTLEDQDLAVVVVNSVLAHNSADEAKRGTVSQEHLKAIEGAIKELAASRKVALVHHHPIQHEDVNLGSEDLMVNGSLLVELFASYDFHVVVHGHKHYPRLKYSQEPTVPVFAAGSVSAKAPMNTRNTFHMLYLEDDDPEECVRAGRVETWVYMFTRGWKRVQTAAPDFPASTGFGFRGNEPALASKISALFNDGRSLASWAYLQKELPQINYLTPGQYANLEARLSADGLAFYEHGSARKVLARTE